MYTAKIENKNGAILTLTGDEPTFQVLSVIGLNPPPAQVNLTTIVGMDGAVFNSSKLETRNIVLTVKINGNVEQNRLALYRMFKTKEWCRFYYKTDTLDTFIDGYVESVECDYFTNGEQAQISIICPSAYFKSVYESIDDISASHGLFVFPFSINVGEPVPFGEYDAGRETDVYNGSESDCGAEFVITVSRGVTDITVVNNTSGEWFSLDGSRWEGGRIPEGAIVRVNTNRGHKRVTIQQGNEIRNGFSVLRNGSSFIQLQAGSNLLSYSVSGGSDDDVSIEVRHYNVYRGV